MINLAPILLSAYLRNNRNNNQPQVRADNTYSVQPGDSLWKISQKYGLTLELLVNANPQIADPNLIYPGQIINIPTETNDTTGEVTDNTPPPSSAGFQEQVVALVNEERTTRGLAPLTMDTGLSRVAQYKSNDMLEQNYFSHTSPVYGSPFEMLQSFGIAYSAAGENIAKGQTTPQSVVESWMNSPQHRDNILNPNFTKIGVGYVQGDNTTYWTQLFTRP